MLIGNLYDTFIKAINTNVLVTLIHQTIYFGKEETTLSIPIKSFMSKRIHKRNFTNFKVAISATVFTVFQLLSRFTEKPSSAQQYVFIFKMLLAYICIFNVFGMLVHPSLMLHGIRELTFKYNDDDKQVNSC